MKNRVLSIIAIITLIVYIVINFGCMNNIYAAQSNEEYNASKISNYPGYKELIEDMKARHPNWNFTIFYTGLDWNQVIKNETSAAHGRNVVPASKGSSWKCSVCGETPRGGSSWRCASETAVAYYMDPRNWINDSYIFQFETLSYNGNIQTVEGVQKIISNIGYMQGSTVRYTQTDGSLGTLNKSYAQIIMEAAGEANISPYHLAARLKQEQGAGNSPGATATGTYGGYVGYYNFMNIGASGSTDSVVIKNGLEYAKNKGWTDPEKSIKAGAKELASKYINDGQDTLYLQKFDVDNSDGALYWHQYMQNVSVCLTEGASVRNTYNQLGLLSSSIDFRIPVYENMPATACRPPVEEGIVTQNVKIKGTSVNIRSGASTSSSIIACVDTGYNLLRIELASSTNGGYYWDKVVLPDGSKGYVVRQYLVEIPDITNCNDIVITNNSVNLRNGPGTEGTTVITTLVTGQMLTRIETGKYNLNGYIWDRVKLADGRQGYIAQNYIDKSGESTSNSAGELIKVICPSGLKVREQPGTGQKVLTYVDSGEILTRTQANVSDANGYIWDKVVTSSGIEGYIARGDSREQYIEVISSNNNTNNTSNNTTNDSNNNIKVENDNIVCEPATTVETLKEKYTDKTVTVTNLSGTVVDSGKLGTGYKVTIGSSTYTIVKLGDGNGDTKINSADALVTLKHSAGIENKSGEYLLALDVNRDGKANSADALMILKNSAGLVKIQL